MKKLALVSSSFIAFFGLIIVLRRYLLISVQEAMLMLVALIGLYFGVGVLVLAYRLVVSLEKPPQHLRAQSKATASKDK